MVGNTKDALKLKVILMRNLRMLKLLSVEQHNCYIGNITKGQYLHDTPTLLNPTPAGDIITKINNTNITQAAQVKISISLLRVGSDAKITIQRDGKEITLNAIVTDVKKHIDSIAKKYIQPEEGTFDFAFMYIMAENVYYEIITRDEDAGQEESLHAYALKKRVIPVSPNSFYAYLGAMMHALRGERMEKNVFEMVSQIRHLTVELGKFREDFEKIGYHLNNLRASYETSEKRLNRYQDSMEKMENTEGVLEARPVKLIS